MASPTVVRTPEEPGVPAPLTSLFTPCWDAEYTADYSEAATEAYRQSSCYPSSATSQLWYSPGIICPHGFTANHTGALTDYGAEEMPETRVLCFPSGFKCRSASLEAGFPKSICVTTITTPVAAVSTVYPTGNRTTTSTVLSTLQPPVIYYVDPIDLRYRAKDVSSFTPPTEGAKLADNEIPTAAEAIFDHSVAHPIFPEPFDPIKVSAIIGGISLALITIGVLFFQFLAKRKLKRNGHLGHPREPSPLWKIGVGPTIPALFSVPLGIFSILFAMNREWQDEMTMQWNSKDVVLNFVQILGIMLRLCATTLAWCLVVDSGWLLLARGASGRDFINIWNMCAAGGSYSLLLQAFWSKVKSLSILRVIILMIMTLAVIAADMTGTAMVASVGVANTTVSPLSWEESVPFINAWSSRFSSRGGAEGDTIEHIFSSGEFYPHIIRDNETGITALLPVRAGQSAPSYYSGIALFGPYQTDCRLTPVSGTINFSITKLALNVSQIDLSEWEDMKISDFGNFNSSSNLINQTAFFTTDEMFYNRARDGSWYLDNVTLTVGLDYSRRFTYGDPTRYPVIAHLDTFQTNPLSPVYHFAVLRVSVPQNSKLGLEYLELEENNIRNTITQSSSGTFKMDTTSVRWEFQICRTEVPFSVGIITANITTSITPLLPCSSTFCANQLGYRKSSITTTSWTDDEISRNLRVTRFSKDTGHRALKPFIPDMADAIINKQPGISTGPNYCTSCGGRKTIGKLTAKLVAEANSTYFQEAFSASLFHAIAATYRGQLAFFEGKGPAEWMVPREVSLIVKPKWLWLAIAYTWALIFFSFVLRMMVLKIVGVERSGSVLATAAMVYRGGPLQPLIERGYMHSKDDFDLDIDDEKDVWKKEIKLGLLADGTYGIGRSSEVKGLTRRRTRTRKKSRFGRGILKRRLSVDSLVISKENAGQTWGHQDFQSHGDWETEMEYLGGDYKVDLEVPVGKGNQWIPISRQDDGSDMSEDIVQTGKRRAEPTNFVSRP